MKAAFEMRYLKTAENDLIDIFLYIKQDNPTAATAQLKRLSAALSNLAVTPFMGIVPKDKRLERLGYRMLIIDAYLVFYVVKSKVVQIRRVIHGARRYNFLL